MTIKTLKRKCEQIQEGVPGLLTRMRETYQGRSERWQRSKKGKDMKLDIILIERLLADTIDFTDSIDHLTEEEE